MENEQKPLSKKEKRLLKKQKEQEALTQQVRSSTTKKLLYWGIGIAAVILGFWYLKSLSATPETSLPIPTPSTIAEHDHVAGASESAKLLVEYSDIQCPACASYHPLVKRLIADHGKDIAVVYRHFPLRQLHRNAQLGAQVLEAAAVQGKFWEMQDLLFTVQEEWAEKRNAEELFAGYAQKLQLDVEKFKIDMNLAAARDIVNADYASGIQANVNSTPTFFLNGEKINPGKSYEEFVSNLGLNK